MSSIRRSIQALDLLARKGPLGVRAVALQLGLPLGSVHRLLLDLAEEGVVERTAEGEWELSFRLLEITGLQLDRLAILAPGAPLRREDRARRRRRPSTSMPSTAMAGVCIDKVRGNEGMQLDLPIGSRGPPACRRRRQGHARHS